MTNEKNKRTCQVELAGGLDNSVRRLLHNPGKILKPYIKEGMTVLDVGCGPGFFSIEIAKLIGDSGKVIAADLQEGMLEKVRKKVRATELEKRIEIHKCEQNKIGITEKVDFILAFYMVHEVSNLDGLFAEMKSMLKYDGKIYIIEPKVHVSRTSFDRMVKSLKNLGFEIIASPKVFFSRTVLLENKKSQLNLSGC